MTTAKVMPMAAQPSAASFLVTTHANSYVGGLKTQESAASMAPTSIGSFVVAKVCF